VNATDSTQAIEGTLSQLPAGSWRVVPADSELGFATRMFGLIPVRGRYSGYAGDLTVESDGSAKGSLQVETATVTTGIKKRDSHLRSDDFFASAEHPLMTFALEGIGSQPTGTTITGTLQIRDRTIPIAAPVTIAAHGPDRLRIQAGFTVDHGAAGLAWKRVPQSVQVEASVTLERVG